MTDKLLMLVGMNIGEKRFEPGERIDISELNSKQAKYLVAEGYAQPVEPGQRLPAEVKKAAEAGVASPHVEIAHVEPEGSV